MQRIEPVDAYVARLIASTNEEHQLGIKDPSQATRVERLRVAETLASEADSWYSVEIMIGRRIDSGSKEDFGYQSLILFGPTKDTKFLAGFAHAYFPPEEDAS